MAGRNEEVADLLENIGNLLILKGESYFRIRAYMEAAQGIRALTEEIEDLYRAGRLREIPGVGPTIASRIAEYLETGRSTYYEELKREIPLSAVELLEVPGIGPARAQLLYERLGIRSIAELEEAARQHKLQTIPGFSAKLEARIARDAALVAARARRTLLGVALPVAEAVAAALERNPLVQQASPVGGLRRMQETVGITEVLASTDQPAAALNAFTSLPGVRGVVTSGPAHAAVLGRGNLRVDLRTVPPEEFGAALLFYTGSAAHFAALQARARERGWTLSEHGLFDRDGTLLAARTEEDIYRRLGLDWVPPELREDRGEVEAAAEHRLPRLAALGDIRGDLHVHTNWSDGRATAEEMVEAAIARGYQYLAITDHSRSLRVAGGLSVERMREQRRLIDRLNSRYAPFRILHGAEVDILPGGELDYPDGLLAELDIVTVSVHSAFAQPGAQMTSRILRAVQHPAVAVLNHLTGRLLQRRPEYEVDVEAVLLAAAEHGVAVEINGQPDRLDINDVWARRFREMGGLLVCDSDAHSTSELDYLRYALAVARRAWAGPDGVLNTLPLPRLLSWLGERRGRRRAA
jgi:DNA polymerase (family 10)